MMDFIKFVNDKTVIVTNPIFSKKAVEQYVEKRPNNRKEKLSTLLQEKNKDQKTAVTVMNNTNLIIVGLLIEGKN